MHDGLEKLSKEIKAQIGPLEEIHLGTIDEVLLNPVVDNGQTKGAIGNESPEMFMRDTLQYLEDQIRQTTAQLQVEKDDNEKSTLEASLGELQHLHAQVDELYNALLRSMHGAGNISAAKRVILINGLALIPAVISALNTSRSRVMEARQSDLGDKLELLDKEEEKRRLEYERRRMMAEYVDDSEEQLLDFLLGLGAMALYAKTLPPELKLELTKLVIEQVAAIAGLSPEEAEAVTALRTDTRVSRIEKAMTMVQRGEITAEQMYGIIAGESVSKAVGMAPSIMGKDIEKALPLKLLHDHIVSTLKAKPDQERLAELVPEWQRLVRLAMDAEREGLELGDERLREKQKQIEQAKLDLMRAMEGAPLHSGMLLQVLGKEHVQEITSQVKQTIDQNPAPPATERAEEALRAYERQLTMMGIHPDLKPQRAQASHHPLPGHGTNGSH